MRYFTVLRDLVKREISQYFYLRKSLANEFYRAIVDNGYSEADSV